MTIAVAPVGQAAARRPLTIGRAFLRDGQPVAAVLADWSDDLAGKA